jgi:hypothetical protein
VNGVKSQVLLRLLFNVELHLQRYIQYHHTIWMLLLAEHVKSSKKIKIFYSLLTLMDPVYVEPLVCKKGAITQKITDTIVNHTIPGI